MIKGYSIVANLGELINQNVSVYYACDCYYHGLSKQEQAHSQIESNMIHYIFDYKKIKHLSKYWIF